MKRSKAKFYNNFYNRFYKEDFNKKKSVNPQTLLSIF